MFYGLLIGGRLPSHGDTQGVWITVQTDFSVYRQAKGIQFR